MADPVHQARDPVEVLAEEFLERRRRGEVPSLQEYVERHPELAAEIREVFPALALMADIDPQSAELARSLDGQKALAGGLGLRQLGDFRILRLVGQGGMGVVYEARQESLGRHVALKVLPPAVSGRAHFRERFQREARAAARLHHTNIVPIFGVGEDQGVLYYAMQYIHGQALDAVLEDVKHIRGLGPTVDPAGQSTLTFRVSEVAQGLVTGHFGAAEPAACGQPLPAPVAVPEPSVSDTHSGLRGQSESGYYRSIAWLGVQAAEGLAYAHAQGVLHRDVKPSNLLLDAQGTLWITDFGLAKAEGSADLTQSGEFVGTLRYMAPERFEGKGDARSDCYALGVTLYEMLTLQPPFSGSDRAALVGQISRGTAVPPGRLAPHLPRDLETVALKAMAREPAARYATARELANDLRRFLENRPIKARRSSALERAGRWCRRNPAVASLLGALFFLLSCLAAGAMSFVLWQSEHRHALALAEARAENLYPSLVGQAAASRLSHHVGQRFATLEAVRKAAELVRERRLPPERLDELRTLAIAALALPDLRLLRTWEGYPAGSQAWDADDRLRLYARTNQAGEISLRRLDTDAEVAPLRGGPELCFGPGGRFLLGHGGQRFRVWDVSRADPPLVLEGEVQAFAFHPDGRHLLTRRPDGSLWLYDLDAPSRKPSSPGKLPGPGMALAYDPTGQRLAVSDGGVRIVDATTARVLAVLPDTPKVIHMAWHPSGHYLALATHNREVHVWDLKRLRYTADLWASRHAGGPLAFTPDGSGLLADGHGTLRLWDWRTGRQTLQHTGRSNLRFGPGGRLLIREGSRLSLAAFADGREYRSLAHKSAAGKDVSYGDTVVHPGGRLVAVKMSDGVRLFDLQTGDEVAAVPQQRFRIAFQADGALLTNGDRGLLRWPIRPADPGTWQVGPPQLLFPYSFVDLASDRSGDVIGQATGAGLDGALLVRRGKGAVLLGPHGAAQHLAISPDGTYAATGINDGEEGVKVWDTRTRRLLAHLPLGRHCGGLFSPDGRWLAVSGHLGHQVRKVGTWEVVWAGWDGNTTFSPDGHLFVVASDLGVIRLLESATGRELARLEDANQASPVWPTFTPDGTRLLTTSDDDRNVHVWDLRAIRAQLAELRLDWQAPAYPPAAAADPAPLQVKVELGDVLFQEPATVAVSSFRLALDPFDAEAYFRRGRAYGLLEDHRKAVADYSLALALMPAAAADRGEALLRRSSSYRRLNDAARADADLCRLAEEDLAVPEGLRDLAALECNNLAWRYATEAGDRRDPKKALALAEKAVRLNAEEWTFLNTLGVVYYRAGRYPQALATLQRSLHDSGGESAAFDLYFLAMCHARAGAADKARGCFDQAVRWVEQNPNRINAQRGWRAELNRFRAEAEALLKGPPNPGR
jgi:serine/threonine protein kinase/WD40 repeat protein